MLTREWLLPRPPFEGCRSNYRQAQIVLVGAGYDGTATYRPGSRFAPQAIRNETLLSQENFSPYFRRDLSEFAIHDAGDLDLPFGNKEEALRRIEGTAHHLFQHHKIPFFIGGEHLITYPIVKAARQHFPGLQVVQLDAHLDLMEELFGDRLSHGTVMRRILEVLDSPEKLFQVAIRSGSKEEFEFAQKHTQLFLFNTQEFQRQIHLLEKNPVYLSVDVDVFDPAMIPGTGTPEAGGIFFPEFIDLLHAMKHLHIIGCDVVELAPKIDPTGNSTITVAKIVRELLITLAID